MRKLLMLAFLLYNIIAIAANANSYDYEDVDGAKRHAMMEDRRNWRKKALSKQMEDDNWERKRYEYDNPRYMDEMETKSFNGIDRQRELDVSAGYKHRRYDDDKTSLTSGRSSEITHSSSEKDLDKKIPLEINCMRPHEKYESCFAGCASVTCDNPRDRMQPCYPFCEAGCICMPPYVRDDRTHKCVLPEDCTKGLKGIPDLGEDATT